MTTTKFTSAADTAGLAFRFVLIVGIANLFADMTYEGPAASPDLFWVRWVPARPWLVF